MQTAYVKASSPESADYFGISIDFNRGGTTLVVGANREDSNSGAVYIFNKNNDVWEQNAYIKASNDSRYFGYSVALSLDGQTLAVGARYEDTNKTGVITDGSESLNPTTASLSGAVYLFKDNNGEWAQIAYVKASNTDAGDYFGHSVALSGDGTTLAVGANWEDNSVAGIITDGSEAIDDTGTAEESGALYLFSNSSGSWAQIAYIKASNTDAGDEFGSSVAISDDGNTFAVGAPLEDKGIKGLITDGSEVVAEAENDAGAVYVY
jgi:hypothetical protein